MGEQKKVSDPHIRALVWDRGETFEAERVKHLICNSLNGIRRIAQTVLATAIRTSDRDVGPLEGTLTGSLSVVMVEQSRDMSAVDYREIA